MTGSDALLASLPPWTLVGGKGGVGKTTCAAALAVRSARLGARTLVLSTDPAGALGDVLGASLGGEPAPHPAVRGLFASQLDAPAARTAFLAEWGEILATIIDRGTYLDRGDIDGLVAAAMPGVDEAMALLALADLAESGGWTRVILDTAPTGHTLRLLALPDTFRALIDLLDTMQAKHRFMVAALLHRYQPDAADAFIAALRERVAKLRGLLTEGGRAGVLLVTRADDVVLAETERYAAALRDLKLDVRAVLVNALPLEVGTASLARVAAVAADAGLFAVRARAPLIGGIPDLERWADDVRHLGDDAALPPPRPRVPVADGGLDGLRVAGGIVEGLPPLLIVGGKGGVGKTSVSCAIGLAAARAGARTLLVSTDPAPSIADAMAQDVGDAEVAVRDGHGLLARQIDASAAFARWRSDYQSRVDAAFDALLGPGLDAAHDRAVARELLSLAPPGIDELYALVWLGDAIADGGFERIVIDPAPTGHLIRLLEIPGLALDWSHRLLRLMLKYRELAGGGETSAEILAFARRTRAVGDLLRDPERAGILVVTLDEPVVRAESVRVVDRVRALGDHVPAVVWNRAVSVPVPLPVTPPVRQFVAADLDPAPIGAARMLTWLDGWRVLDRDG